MTDEPTGPPISISLDGFTDQQDAEMNAFKFMLNQQGVGKALVAGILELLPDSSLRHLILTEDIATTVNRLHQCTTDNPYTTARGAGHVGAVTIPPDDGTFDIVISTHVFFATRGEVENLEELVAHAVATAAHLRRHEAGHAALQLRGEDAAAYRDVSGLSATDAACRKPLALHIDDTGSSNTPQYTARRR